MFGCSLKVNDIAALWVPRTKRERDQSSGAQSLLVLVTNNALSSEKVRIVLQKDVLLVTRSLVARPSQHEFTIGSEAFCIDLNLHLMDAT